MTLDIDAKQKHGTTVGKIIFAAPMPRPSERVKCTNRDKFLCEKIADLEAELAKANTACGKWNVDYNKTYSELCEAHVEIDMLEADLARVRQVAEDAIADLRGFIYGKHTIPGLPCHTCLRADDLEARLK